MSDVTIHIDETLDATALLALQQDLVRMKGVEHVDAAREHPHLMVVRYDNQRLDSGTILSECYDHGYHAELIGF